MRARTSSLVAMFALLLGLYAPLCSIACLDAFSVEDVAAAAAEPPCHGGSPTPTPADMPAHMPAQEKDCGCAAPYALKAPLPVEAMGGTIGGAEGATVRPLLPTIADAAPNARRASLVRNLAKPPPRDTLLVTTTLLI
jgi:hypothetical protein